MTHDQECKFDTKYCRDCKLQAEARADERNKILNEDTTRCIHGERWFCRTCDDERIAAIRADEREQVAQRILTAKEHMRAMPITVSTAWSVWETQVIDACAAAARGGEQE